MNSKENGIFPFVLSALSKKPHQQDTQQNLFKEVKQLLADDNIEAKKLRKDFKEALEIGEDLGIFQLKDNDVKMPFSPKGKVTKTLSIHPSSSSEEENGDEETRDKVSGSRRRRSGRSRGRSASRRRSSARSRSRGRGQRKSRRK